MQCATSMRAACPKHYEAQDAAGLYLCAEEIYHKNLHPDSDSDDDDDDDEDEKPELPGCGLKSRMEKIVGAHIFEPGFNAKVSWGDL